MSGEVGSVMLLTAANMNRCMHNIELPTIGAASLIAVPETTEQWHSIRRTGIGGSDVAAIVGLSPWATADDIRAAKLGTPPRPATAAMQLGTSREAVIVESYADHYGKLVTRPRGTYRGKRAWQIINLDAVALSVDNLAPEGLVEAKLTFNPATIQVVPSYYRMQVLDYLDATELPWCDVVIQDARSGVITTHRICRDEDVIPGRAFASYIPQIEDFWDTVTTAQQVTV